MAELADTIRVDAKAPDIPAEIRECLGAGECRLTLGGFMWLVAVKSPYIKGGTVTDADFDFAKKVCHAEDAEDPHRAISGAIERAICAFNMIVSRMPEKPRDEHSESFGTEWMADMINGIMHAAPGLSYHECLHEMPLLLGVHLMLAEYRRNGGETRRGCSEAEEKAVAELMARRKANG